MLLTIPAVLTADEVADFRRVLDAASWVDGKVTAGYQSAVAKQNLQLPETAPEARELGERVLAALQRAPTFLSAALPLKVFPPLFNRYGPGHAFGSHVDNAIRPVRGTPHKVRTDLSCTLFLCEPEDCEGGELVVVDTYGMHEVKLPAGDLIVYPATSLHRVEPVTRGARTSSFFWTQSMIRDDGLRRQLFELDMAIVEVRRSLPDDHQGVVALTSHYHNLLRRWADL